MTIYKDLCVYLLLYQSLYDLTNQTVCNLKSVLVLTNALGHNLISVFDLTNSLGRNWISVHDLTNPLGRRPISALVLTSHLKCQAILLILLAWPRLFLTAPGCFCLAYNVSSIFYFLQGGLQPIHYATLFGQLDVVSTLVERYNIDPQEFSDVRT